MSTGTETKGRRLEAFFREVEARSAPTAAKRRPDLFAEILLDIEDPNRGKVVAVAPAQPGGTQAVRDNWEGEYANHKATELAGHPDESWAASVRACLPPVDPRRLTKYALTIISIVLAICILIPVGGHVYRGLSEAQARKVAAEQERRRKTEAFHKAWRQSETERTGNALAGEGEETRVAYLKELSPDDGRVHMLYTETVSMDQDSKTWVVTGWTRTQEQKEEALRELRELFPRITSADVKVRPSGGQLMPGEIRTVGHARLMRLEYGESGYLLNEKETSVKVEQPPAGTPYYFVMGGGGIYWKRPQQRQQLIDKAFERLSQSPDGGKGALGIRLVYYDRDTPVVENILISRAPAQADYTNKTATGDTPKTK